MKINKPIDNIGHFSNALCEEYGQELKYALSVDAQGDLFIDDSFGVHPSFVGLYKNPKDDELIAYLFGIEEGDVQQLKQKAADLQDNGLTISNIGFASKYGLIDKMGDLKSVEDWGDHLSMLLD